MPQTIYSQNYPTLQRAFDALASGDTLVIANGEYREEIYMTEKDSVTIETRGDNVIIAPRKVANGFLFHKCDGLNISNRITFRDCYPDGASVNGSIVKREGHFILGVHVAGIHLYGCVDANINDPVCFNCEEGIHAEPTYDAVICDGLVINNANCYQNAQSGIRLKRGDNQQVLGGIFTGNGLNTNPVIINGGSDGHGIVFYGGNNILIDRAYFNDNWATAVKNYEGTTPTETTGFKIKNCEIRSAGVLRPGGDYGLPIYIASINQEDTTFEISGNGLLNLATPSGYYFQVGNYNEGGLKSFSEMEAFLLTLNVNSIDNYVLPFYSAIIATIGGSNSNSYATLAEAEDYFSLRPNSLEWFNANEANKEQVLIQATRDIDTLPIAGEKYKQGLYGGNTYQSLKFPRVFPSTFILSDDVLHSLTHLRDDKLYPDSYNSSGEGYIPINVKYAQFEQALHLLQVGASGNKRLYMQMQGVSSFRLGNFSETYKDKAIQRIVSQRSLDLMREFLNPNIKIARA